MDLDLWVVVNPQRGHVKLKLEQVDESKYYNILYYC